MAYSRQDCNNGRLAQRDASKTLGTWGPDLRSRPITSARAVRVHSHGCHVRVQVALALLKWCILVHHRTSYMYEAVHGTSYYALRTSRIDVCTGREEKRASCSGAQVMPLLLQVCTCTMYDVRVHSTCSGIMHIYMYIYCSSSTHAHITHHIKI